MQETIRQAEALALAEIERHGAPHLALFRASNEEGQKLAKRLDADEGVVALGTRLMDLKLGQAKSEGRIKDHVAMSVAAAREFLAQTGLGKDVVDKVVNCVEAHHGDAEWTCREAEVCANADCYRFLVVRNWLDYLRGMKDVAFEEALAQAEYKLEEKWAVLSLPECKKELEPHYRTIRKIIDLARAT